MSFWRDLFTEKDGISWSLARVGWGASIVTYNAMVIYAVIWNHATLDLQAYGLGLAAVNAAGGAAVGFQAKTEADVKS